MYSRGRAFSNLKWMIVGVLYKLSRMMLFIENQKFCPWTVNVGMYDMDGVVEIFRHSREVI